MESTTTNRKPAAGAGEIATVDDAGRSIESVISALTSVPGGYGRLVNGKPDEELAQPAQDGGWGLIEILPHIRDWEVIYGDRVALMLTAESPSLEEYDDSLWAIEHSYRDQDPREALEEFGALRESLVERLGSLEADEWNRIGILPKRGRVTLHWLMNELCDHDAKHLVQARDVLA